MVKNLHDNAGDARNMSLILGSGRPPGVGNDNPLPTFLPGKFHGQRSLEGDSPEATKSQTRLSTMNL